MIISNDVLERTCKGMIENILFCLSDATKGTIYRVGPMPKLQAIRVTSGIRTPGFRRDPMGSYRRFPITIFRARPGTSTVTGRVR